MSHRQIPYESAFEDYLRSRGVPYVGVDQTRKAIFAGARLKSFDFIVYFPGQRHWIVDVKGRMFPYVNNRGARCYWENWVSRDDIESLGEWQAVFGDEFEARFVFAYFLGGPPDRWPVWRPHGFRSEHYLFLSVRLADYREHCRPRSASWDTVAVPRAVFRRIIGPIEGPAG